ncbi:MAG: hypothetical protein OER90_14365 [Gemmatimonadota bacterium]|nr:hypothetical protein [Gemmatimonadota bacterium]
MSIYTQPNSWLCGPFALKHALLAVGIRADESSIARIAGTNEHGTDESELERAADRFGCALGTVRRRDPDAARRVLNEHLARGVPVLLCIEQWDHWVTAVCEEDDTYVVLDSRHPAVFRIIPWEFLRELLAYRPGRRSRGGVPIYDLHPVVPRNRSHTRPRFTVERAKFLQEWENQPLVADWDRYVDDTVNVCRPVGFDNGASGYLSPGEFFGRHEFALLDTVGDSHSGGKRSKARAVLRGLRFVADTYGLDVPAADAAVARVREILARHLAEHARKT